MFRAKRYRAFIAFVLVSLSALIVGCSSVAEEPKPVYTVDQIALINDYQADLQGLRTRVDEIPELVNKKDWTNVRNLIHGPLGELRFKMLTIARNLSSSDQSKARELSNDVFKYLVAIDAASEAQDKEKAIASYDQLVSAYEKFIDTIPDQA
jgi:photosystem II protein PsbQ